VGAADVQASTRGIDGLAAVNSQRCGLALGALSRRPDTRRFGQARALGRILVHPGQRQFILSAARSYDDRVARAFAAELLAPAQGIRQMLDTAGEADDGALETVADRYNVSPLLVRHQYENQIAL
jgi:Zn-dependent peptidase ImmA (M78 family)